MSQSSDQLYAQPLEAITGFVFDQNVVRVFRDMISRSVPGYATLVSMLPVLAQAYVQDNSQVYDLGCSLGAASLALRHGLGNRPVRIIAVDSSDAMISQCRQYLDTDTATVPVDLNCADICEFEITRASLIIMNFTLQFIAPDQRLDLLAKIHKGMLPGGALVLSEKILFDEPRQSIMTGLHHGFKKLNGYSDLEISQKRTALENVLIADSLERHQQRLSEAGFSQVMPWFQCFNFISLLAIK